MDNVTQTVTLIVHVLGFDHWLPVVFQMIALSAALDAAVPQPKPGSHWLPVRKIVSLLAFNFANASPADQPSILTWVQHVLQRIAEIAPPMPAPAAPPRVQPLFEQPVIIPPVAPIQPPLAPPQPAPVPVPPVQPPAA